MLLFPSHCFVCIANSCSLLFSYCHVRNQESPLRVMLPSSRKFSNTTLFSSSVKASEQFFLQLSPHGSLKSFLFFNIVSPFLFFVSYASITSVRFSFRHCSFPFFWVHFFLFSSPLNGGIASVPDDSEKSTKFGLMSTLNTSHLLASVNTFVMKNLTAFCMICFPCNVLSFVYWDVALNILTPLAIS